MLPTQDFEAIRGDTFGPHTFTITIEGEDLSATTVKIQWKKDYDANAVLTLTPSTSSPSLGVLTFDYEATSIETANIDPSTYLYDVEITFNAKVKTVLAGKVIMHPDVTQ